MMQYAKYRSLEGLRENRPRALLTFAGNAILDSVRDRKRRWTWAFFAERRDDRRRYVELFKKNQPKTLTNEVRPRYVPFGSGTHVISGVVRAGGFGEKTFV
jgi:intermembrane lipid transfer protein VPS13